MMIERVKGVSHVRPVSLGAGGTSDRDNHKGGNSAFHNLLTQAMKPKPVAQVSENYKVDLERITHSLFYSGDATINLAGRF